MIAHVVSVIFLVASGCVQRVPTYTVHISIALAHGEEEWK